MPTAYIVLDLGFGDAGKGSLVDYLAARTGADPPSGLVVRFNGGGQAAHNVVTPDGLHHTFAQFGSATFLGAKTYLSQPCLWNPIAMEAEAEVLEKTLGRKIDFPYVDSLASVVTPWHQAMGRLREISRGTGRHGSCGVGIGEAMLDRQEHPSESIHARNLKGWDEDNLCYHLMRLADRKRGEWADLADRLMVSPSSLGNSPDLSFLMDKHAPRAVAARLRQIAARTSMPGLDLSSKTLFDNAGDVIFEGAQGIGIDERYGFLPFATWSDCTSSGARQVLSEVGWMGDTKTIGVLRAYGVRHGPGPFVTEIVDRHGNADRGPLAFFKDAHNGTGPWQGPMRYGWFDAVLAHYTMRAEKEAGSFSTAFRTFHPGVDCLAITCVDQVDRMLGSGLPWEICDEYEWHAGRRKIGPLVFEPGCFATQEEMTEALQCVVPLYRHEGHDSEGLLAAIEGLLRCPIEIVSHGPSWNDKEWRKSPPTTMKD